jgi:hypothetical protein
MKCSLGAVSSISSFLFQTIGGLMMGVGFYSVTQKNEYTEFTSTSTDPGALIVAVGFIIFFVSFAGTIGALRENTTLLRVVSPQQSLSEIFHKSN